METDYCLEPSFPIPSQTLLIFQVLRIDLISFLNTSFTLDVHIHDRCCVFPKVFIKALAAMFQKPQHAHCSYVCISEMRMCHVNDNILQLLPARWQSRHSCVKTLCWELLVESKEQLRFTEMQALCNVSMWFNVCFLYGSRSYKDINHVFLIRHYSSNP